MTIPSATPLVEARGLSKVFHTGGLFRRGRAVQARRCAVD